MMKTVLVAGATGYLGRYVVRALKGKGFRVRALGRSDRKLHAVTEFADELFIGEVTDPTSLAGVCDGIDFVFSAVGITRQKDGLTYFDVDYQGNKNLLDAASASGVTKFVYVHVLNAAKMQDVALVRAKQAFVDDLESSGLDYTIVCPTGFFSDMEEFFTMAASGRAVLFGDGSNRINPIHGADLAEVCVDALTASTRRIDAGGPDVLTYREIAELAFETLEKPARITCIPRKLSAAAVTLMRWITPVRIHGPVHFLASVMTMDVVGQTFGQRRLADHFRHLRARSAGSSDVGTSPQPTH